MFFPKQCIRSRFFEDTIILMPCDTCDSLLIYYNDRTVCHCWTDVLIIPYDDSIKIIQYQIEKSKRIFENIIRPYIKNELIKGVFWAREMQIRRFSEAYSAIETDKLVSSSHLLRRLVIMNNFYEKKHINMETIQTMISMYIKIIDLEDAKIKLEAKNFNMISTIAYDMNRLENIQPKSVGIFANENYNRLKKTFAKHGIFSEEQASTKIQEGKKNIRSVEAGSNRITSITQIIEKFYDFISSLYVSFFRNRVYQEAFSFPMQSIQINPIDIRRFYGKYPMVENPTEIDFQSFKDDLMQVINDKFEEVGVNFILSEDNKDAFPLFVKLGDAVIISQAFGELYCYFLHAIVHKREFDRETEKRSKIYEQKIVKKHFENLGFRYYNNFSIKGKMEIDGIAISEDAAYVIEVKGWGSRKLLEEKTSEELLKREIKSAIIGIKHNFTTGKITTKRSIKEKVQWVSENKGSFRIKQEITVAGLLVINEQPVITKYLNCEIINVADMANP